jgi:hypothetical protein
MLDELITLESTSGMIEAEIVRSLLEAHGVQVWLSHESAGTAIGLGIGPLAQVDLLIHRSQEEEARIILDDYHAGNLDKSEFSREDA